MAADAHAAARAVGIVRRPGHAGRFVLEVARRVEVRRLVEVRGVVVGGVGVHVEGRAGRDEGVLPADVLDAPAREADGDDGPEAEGFLDERGDVGDFFFLQAFVPGVLVRVDGVDLVEGALLDLLAVGGGEVGEAHDYVAGDCVEAG